MASMKRSQMDYVTTEVSLKGMPKPWWFLFHPFKSIKLIFSTAKKIIKSMIKSAFRKRGTKPWDIYRSNDINSKPD